MVIHWTYSLKDLRPSEIKKHERAKTRVKNESVHIGGLDRYPMFTHCIATDGRVLVLDYCPGSKIHIALIGGVNSDYKYANTATYDQLQALGNLVRFYQSLGEVVEEGDLLNFNLKEWIKAISQR